MSDTEFVLSRASGPVTTLTLNRPERLNAVTLDLYRQFLIHLTSAEDDPQTRVVVLAGEGRAFCVGADLKEHRTMDRTEAERRTYAEKAQEVCTRIQLSPKPILCLIQGYALGAGAEMALSADFVIMADDARIGFPEISIGTYIGGGLSFILPQLVGLAAAKELLFLGEKIDGPTAAAMRLIYRSVPPGELESAGRSLADRLAGLAPVPLSIAKTQLRTARLLPHGKAMGEEVEGLLRCMSTKDWAEGVRAFAEKRKPEFRGE